MNIHKIYPRVLASLLGLALLVNQAQALQQGAETLLQRHAELREQLAENQFQRPIVVESSDQDGKLKGEIMRNWSSRLPRSRRSYTPWPSGVTC